MYQYWFINCDKFTIPMYNMLITGENGYEAELRTIFVNFYKSKTILKFKNFFEKLIKRDIFWQPWTYNPYICPKQGKIKLILLTFSKAHLNQLFLPSNNVGLLFNVQGWHFLRLWTCSSTARKTLPSFHLSDTFFSVWSNPQNLSHI